MHEPISANPLKLNCILDIYIIDQLINEPTRITNYSQTLIDPCLINVPSKTIKSGVDHISISDHSLVLMTYKTNLERIGSRIIQTRCLKNFNRDNFLKDMEQKRWCYVNTNTDPKDMWATWKSLLMECIDKHAPSRFKSAGKKNHRG